MPINSKIKYSIHEVFFFFVNELIKIDYKIFYFSKVDCIYARSRDCTSGATKYKGPN